MDWAEVVRYAGIALSVMAGLWLWILRRRRRLNWERGIGGGLLMVAGIAADLWPAAILTVLCFPTLILEMIGLILSGFSSSKKGAVGRWDISGGVFTHEDIEFELAKKEFWAQSVHRP